MYPNIAYKLEIVDNMEWYSKVKRFPLIYLINIVCNAKKFYHGFINESKH